MSHCHYYTTMVEWSDAFGGVPIYLHENNRKWVQRESKAIVYWSGEAVQDLAVGDALSCARSLLRRHGSCTGADGANGAGALFTGDVMQVTQDRRFVSFMYSYPNYIPLNAATVRRIGEIIEPLAFDRIYGAFWHRVIADDAKAASRASVARYLSAIA